MSAPGDDGPPQRSPTPHRLVGGWDRHDAIPTTSWQQPPEHLVASMARDVVVDMGW